MIACSGHSVATLFRFGETAMSHRKTRLEEVWTIEEVAFNVPGLSLDYFIPPADLRHGCMGKAEDGENGRSSIYGDYKEKVTTFETSSNAGGRNMIWRVEV
ncbi:hypothetical protein HPP92_026341 [Vanilla planifolia]|uniref:Uncharacterized protein n=1 Tax=Vanilla planifolia TaxID=51239 RepID=A0A835PEY0_VANPL|nr:hypothetical protein HPP92_026563 [Vanilla planifolia]KAG0451185.1 hypothetical protein HPP92_026341 [Vanilla planifolia]